MMGTFEPEFVAPVRQHVAGLRVLDYGAGLCARAFLLRWCGAEEVLAVDAGPMPPLDGVRQFEGWFGEPLTRQVVTDFRPHVVHLGWPACSSDLWPTPAVRAAPIVIYVGCTTDFTSCGSPDLFAHFLRRPVLAYVPARRNTLIIYGSDPKLHHAPRKRLYHAELAGLDQSRVYAYDPSTRPRAIPSRLSSVVW